MYHGLATTATPRWKVDRALVPCFTNIDAILEPGPPRIFRDFSGGQFIFEFFLDTRLEKMGALPGNCIALSQFPSPNGIQIDTMLRHTATIVAADAAIQSPFFLCTDP
ncbi:MAG: hypothetical protein JW829_15830 [Pirellulales bacterium]|nr:hypothetical protein [Pirellulales bacterium]